MTPTTRDQNSAAQVCPHFYKKKCGGCAYLHVPYQDQLAAKEKKVAAILASALRRLPSKQKPDLAQVLQPIVPSPAPLGYRASAKLTLHQDKSGRKTVGLFAQGTRTVVSTAGCPANTAPINDLVQRLFLKIEETGLQFFDHTSTAYQKNCLKYLTVRAGPVAAFDAAHMAIIISHTGVDRQRMATWLDKAGLSGLAAFESKLVKEDGDALTGRATVHLSGPTAFSYELANQTYQMSPVSFFQANHSLAAGLIAYTADFQRGGDLLLDLYGGFGAYSFAVQRRFKSIMVVDGNGAAIDAANAHAKQHGVDHLKAYRDLCEHFLEHLAPQSAARVTHVIVNPARNGLSPEVLAHVTGSFPHLKELHYVSCSPPTFARDTATLLARGFHLRELTPFDMFPQTDHVELAAKFAVNARA